MTGLRHCNRGLSLLTPAMEATFLDTRQLNWFMLVAETGSFRKAAEKIGVRQSAVSRRIQRLEDTLGVSLFERRTTGAHLTVAGTSFLENTRGALWEMQRAVDGAQSAGEAACGKLRIGFSASISNGAFRNLLTAFFGAHAHVEVSFVEADRNSLLTSLSHRRIDAVFSAGLTEPVYGESIALVRQAIYLAVPTDHELASCDRIGWSETRSAPFISSIWNLGAENHTNISGRNIDLGSSVTVQRHRISREAIMALVGLGIGVSLIADHGCDLPYPNVTFVPYGDENETIPFSVTWRPENDNPALRRFISLARIEAKRNGAPS